MRRFNLMVIILFSVFLFTEGAALSANSFDPNVSWWKGENNATDSVGSNNGTLHGGITFAAGKIGQAFSFDGTAQYVSIPSSASLNIFGTHTVAFWVKPNALPTAGKNYQLVSKWVNGIEHKQVSINANGTVSYFLFGTTAGSGVTSTTALQPGVWSHVAATYDGANMKIYINGVQDASTAATGDVSDSTGTLYLGYNPDTAAFAGGGEAYFNGLLDEVGWYDRALSATEVADLKKLEQAITFGNAPTVVVAGTGTVSATATSALAVSYSSSTPTVCSVSGSTVTGVAVGTCTIAANQAGDSNYNAATEVSQSFTIGKGSQTINFADAPVVAVGKTGTVSATATSGLAVSFSSTTLSVCTISNSTVTGLIAGTCTIAANQAGNGNYNAASEVTQNIAIVRPIQIPQTGQTICYDAGATAIACVGTGQDAEKLAGAIWPSTRFTDNSIAAPTDLTITDNLTGLIWTKSGNLPAAAKTWQEALSYINTLNSSNYLGHNDWRLPNRNELESLVNKQQPDMATWLNAQGFTNVQSNYYWSSSSYAKYPSYAWFVSMGSGGVGYDVRYNNFYVWPVRGGQSGSLILPKTGQTTSYSAGDDGALQVGAAWPSSRFTDNSIAAPADLTITDELTGLIWTKNGNLMISRDPSFDQDDSVNDGKVTWQHALDYIRKLNDDSYLGHNDWRLPNRNELQSLVNIQQPNPATWLNTQGFTNVQSNYYWSSSSFAYGPSSAWVVGMNVGDVNFNSNSYYYVWPVRDGQWGKSVISVSPAGKYFGSVTTNTTSASQTFTISNNCTGTRSISLVINSISLTGGDSSMFTLTAGDGTGGACGAAPTIANGASCTVSVTFTPTSAGAKATMLRIASSDQTAPNKYIALSGNNPEPVSWWQAENNAYDTLGGNNGTVYGATYTAGKAGQAFSFNGTDNYVAQGSSYKNVVSNTFTMEFWANPAATRDVTPPANSGASGTSNQRYAIFPEHGGADVNIVGAGVSVGTNGVSVFEHTSDNLYSPIVYDAVLSGWTHIAVVYTDKVATLYVNGVLVATGVTPRDRLTQVFPSSQFGGTAYGYYQGALDEVRIFNRALTSYEILQMNTFGLTVTKSGTGSGTVTTNVAPGTLSWTGSTGTASYTDGASVTLTATPETISTFGGWSGDCTADPCILTMDAAKTVTATFTLAPVAKNITKALSYFSLATALSEAAAGDEIDILDTQLDGAVSLDKAITLSGGWNATYLGLSGQPTTLNGDLTIQSGGSIVGTVDVKGKLVIQSGSLRANGVTVRP
jgi:hypothetical protein